MVPMAAGQLCGRQWVGPCGQSSGLIWPHLVLSPGETLAGDHFSPRRKLRVSISIIDSAGSGAGVRGLYST